MIIDNAFTAITEMDLEPIKMKLMHQTFGEGWSKARADAMATEYRRFLYLQYAHPGEISSPTEDVDTFWHYHILDTMKYAADCNKAFGYFMHHYPYVGLLESDEVGIELKAAKRTEELYEATFGEAYIRAEAYGEQAAALFDEASADAHCQFSCVEAYPAKTQATAAPCEARTTRMFVAVQATSERCQADIAAKSAAGKAHPARCVPVCGAFHPATALTAGKLSPFRTAVQLA